LHSFLAEADCCAAGDTGLFPQTRGNRRSGSVYHTIGDTIKVIESDALERVMNTAVQVIRRLDS
jgi:hypothetical protein